MPSLPTVPPASRLDHIWFELTGGHAKAVSILVGHLGWVGAGRAAAGLARRQVFSDPFRDLPRPAADDVGAWLTRRQLLPVILLDDALQQDLGMPADRARAVLGDLVADVGAVLLKRRFPALEAATWAASEPEAREAVVRRVFARLGNIAAADVRSGDDWVALDVKGCTFVALCHAVGKPDLAPLFCAADGRFFDRPDAPVTLQRTTTLATGGACCDFRFALPPAGAPSAGAGPGAAPSA